MGEGDRYVVGGPVDGIASFAEVFVGEVDGFEFRDVGCCGADEVGESEFLAFGEDAEFFVVGEVDGFEEVEGKIALAGAVAEVAFVVEAPDVAWFVDDDAGADEFSCGVHGWVLWWVGVICFVCSSR